MTRRRALLVCPGRGSYERASQGQFTARSSAATAVVDRCDNFRSSVGRTALSALDRADWSARAHIAGENASLLTAACSWADAADLDDSRYEVVGVVGNSMGWYTALFLAGVLTLDDAIVLVDTLGSYQENNVIGGQVLMPVCGEDWCPDADAQAVVEHAISEARAAGFVVEHSIRLVGYAVLGADVGGLKFLMATLPQLTRGARTFPVQLPLHSAFHTSLMGATAEKARADLGGLQWRTPSVPVVDGRGVVFRPRWADPSAIAAWTLGAQITETFDLTTTLKTALRHTAPEVVVALGPGNALGGPLARAIVWEGWRGMRTRADFDAAQQSSEPPLLSFGVKLQRVRLTRGG